LRENGDIFRRQRDYYESLLLQLLFEQTGVMLGKTYYLHSYGCQMNLADSDILSAAMEAAGYRAVADPSEAGVIIINTCSVRKKAEERALGRLRELAGLKENGQVRICVVGCMAQRYGNRLLKQIPEVDFVLGTERLFELPALLAQKNGCPVVDTAMGNTFDWAEYASVPNNPYSALITITRGCNNYCAYCVVPYLRGPERHRKPQAIIVDIDRLTEKGIVEITLVGQNVNSYDCDGLRFPGLIRKVASETDVKRIRFITSHPKDISDDLIALFSEEPKLTGHIHLPLQSGSDRILKMMFRRYTLAHYRSKIEKLRRARRDIAVTTDLIVGFPTETEKEYRMTLDAVSEVEFDSAFMFRYSVREETWAAKNLKDDVPEAVKLERLKGLIDLQKEIAGRVNQREIGLVREVLVDGTSRRNNNVRRGKTQQNKTILFDGDENLLGKIVPIRVVGAGSRTLHGELVNDA
jgi:tRNA-2-methylthio-N6-dimethylallyladenosine synthase